jgi:Mlc titration factor MtfA (ptsG expression regulator)
MSDSLLYFLIIVLVSCLLLYRLFTRKARRRKAILKTDFPAEWRHTLQTRVGFYHTLSEEEKKRFEQLVQTFIGEKRIIGIKTKIDDTVRVLVAASAIIPVFGFNGWEYDNLGEVFVTEGAVGTRQIDEQNQNIIAGQVQPFQNQHYMTISRSALEQGFSDMKDRQNVGIHEFAHLLDEADGVVDGVPNAYLPDELVQPWKEIMNRKMQEIKNGENNINPYGATSPAEFFAVMTEYFFEDPARLQKNHPRTYKLLTKVFGQNPHLKYRFDFNQLLNPNGRRLGRNEPCPCGSGEKYKNCCLDAKEA